MESLQLFSAGHLEETRTVAIATHLELCTKCNQDVRDLDAIGGICLENITPVEMHPTALETFWKKARSLPPHQQAASIKANNDFRPESARSLSQYIGSDIDHVKWRKIAPGISQYTLKTSDPKPNSLRLLKINPDVKIPTHTHKNHELSLILRGAYQDELSIYREGDLADLDQSHHHSPKAIGNEPCICLLATTGPLAFKSVLSKAIQPFIGL